MTVSRKTLCVVYGVIAVLALIGTWGHNISYLDRGFVGANQAFWSDTLANAASRSITADIFFLGSRYSSGWCWRRGVSACVWSGSICSSAC